MNEAGLVAAKSKIVREIYNQSSNIYLVRGPISSNVKYDFSSNRRVARGGASGRNVQFQNVHRRNLEIDFEGYDINFQDMVGNLVSIKLDYEVSERWYKAIFQNCRIAGSKQSEVVFDVLEIPIISQIS
ncbi:MAG: hypothetical protein FWF59_02340 [Turicibacter sp.]|nr:hypothetical protein [Turicibacter sp.]